MKKEADWVSINGSKGFKQHCMVPLLTPLFPCAVGLLATPHRSLLVEDSPSTLALSISVNAEVSTPPTSRKCTSVPGKSVAKDEEKKQNI